MQNPSVAVTLFEGMGRGIVATSSLRAGEVVMQCEILKLNIVDTVQVNQTELQYYTFKYDKHCDCLVLGNGEIFNHSARPSVKYELVDFFQEGVTRKVMLFTALRDITRGEQLLIDYQADTHVMVDGYMVNKSLMGA